MRRSPFNGCCALLGNVRLWLHCTWNMYAIVRSSSLSHRPLCLFKINKFHRKYPIVVSPQTREISVPHLPNGVFIARYTTFQRADAVCVWVLYCCNCSILPVIPIASNLEILPCYWYFRSDVLKLPFVQCLSFAWLCDKLQQTIDYVCCKQMTKNKFNFFQSNEIKVVRWINSIDNNRNEHGSFGFFFVVRCAYCKCQLCIKLNDMR